jgi:hypothetical protein
VSARADAAWLVELLRRIDLMSHALAVHGQLLVDVANSVQEDDEPPLEVAATEIMRRVHDVCDWREKLADHTDIERAVTESLAWQATLAAEKLAMRELREHVLSQMWRDGYRRGLDTGYQMAEQQFAEVWLKRQPWFQFLCAICERAASLRSDGVLLATIQAVGAEAYERSLDGHGGQV